MTPETAPGRRTPTAFGRHLRAARVAAGLSQAGLGVRAGVARDFVARLEMAPSANPTLSTIRRLAAALGCPVADLVAD